MGFTTDFDESRLNFAGFLVSHGSCGVLDYDEVTIGIDVAVFTLDFGTFTGFLMSNVGLSVVIGHLVSVTVLRVIL